MDIIIATSSSNLRPAPSRTAIQFEGNVTQGAKRWNHLEIPQLFLVISVLATSTMESLKNYWSELMEIREARWLVALTGLIICICVGFYVVKLFRDMALGGSSDPTSYITDFQKLRDEGKLDDEEYARLKQSIPKQLPDELMGNNEDS